MRKCRCHDDLTKAKAELARLRHLPEKDFNTVNQYGQLYDGFVHKANAIARAKAKVEQLKVLTTTPQSKEGE